MEYLGDGQLAISQPPVSPSLRRTVVVANGFFGCTRITILDNSEATRARLRMEEENNKEKVSAMTMKSQNSSK